MGAMDFLDGIHNLSGQAWQSERITARD